MFSLFTKNNLSIEQILETVATVQAQTFWFGFFTSTNVFSF